jgi:penicillin amidase
VGWTLTVLLTVVGGVAWWLLIRPLPQVDGTVSLPGLQHEVTVERDFWGIPHVRAGSLSDMVEAQGYVMAQDRLFQMDLLRRVAGGSYRKLLDRRRFPWTNSSGYCVLDQRRSAT